MTVAGGGAQRIVAEAIAVELEAFRFETFAMIGGGCCRAGKLGYGWEEGNGLFIFGRCSCIIHHFFVENLDVIIDRGWFRDAGVNLLGEVVAIWLICRHSCAAAVVY